MSDTEESQGQSSVTAQKDNFGGNFNAQFYSGKDGVANAAMDIYGAATSALYSTFSADAGEDGKLPGPIGMIGIAVNVVVSSVSGSDITCSVIGATGGAAVGVASAAGAAVITELASGGGALRLSR